MKLSAGKTSQLMRNLVREWEERLSLVICTVFSLAAICQEPA